MATHSSVLAWRIPGTEEPGRRLSMGSQSRTTLKRLSSSNSSTFCHKGGVICISEVIDISPGNLDSSLCFFQSSVSETGMLVP